MSDHDTIQPHPPAKASVATPSWRDVEAVLRAPGEPLDEATRELMERRFGHSFADVRVHAGGDAARAASAIGASAFTLGRDVVIDAVPADLRGRRHVLAHELAHVVQQSDTVAHGQGRLVWTAPVGGAIVPGSAIAPDDRAEREADVAAQRITAGRAVPPISVQSGTRRLQRQRAAARAAPQITDSPERTRGYVESTIAMFDAEVRHLRAGGRTMFTLAAELRLDRFTFESGQQAIRVTLGEDRELAERLRAAYARLVRALLSAEAARTGRAVEQLYTQHRDVIWPPGFAARHANELTDPLTPAERQRIRVVTAEVTLPDLAPLFARSGTLRMPQLPAGTTVRFGSGIPQQPPHFRRGLTAVAEHLVKATTEDLAHRPRAGQPRRQHAVLPENATATIPLDLVPFGGPRGAFQFTRVRRQAASEILVEYLGRLGPEGPGPMAEQVARQRMRALRIRTTGLWSAADMAALLAAVALVPQAALQPLAGLTVERQHRSPDDTGEGGHYDRLTHTITLYDTAFRHTAVQYGQPGAGVSTEATRAIVHEIGHAIDLAPVRRTTAAGARSLSGQQIVRGRDGVLTDVEGPRGAGAIEFRRAAQADGATRITDYAETEWQEYFAEAFSLYLTAPDQLRRLRPAVFAYFQRTFAAPARP